MYSSGPGQLGGVSYRQALEQLGEFGAGEFPLERLSEDLVAGLEGEDPGGQLLERGGIGRREDLALEDAEIDLDLVEPTGVDRQMNGHEPGCACTRRRTAAPPRCELPLSRTQKTRRAERYGSPALSAAHRLPHR